MTISDLWAPGTLYTAIPWIVSAVLIWRYLAPVLPPVPPPRLSLPALRLERESWTAQPPSCGLPDNRYAFTLTRLPLLRRWLVTVTAMPPAGTLPAGVLRLGRAVLLKGCFASPEAARRAAGDWARRTQALWAGREEV